MRVRLLRLWSQVASECRQIAPDFSTKTKIKSEFEKRDKHVVAAVAAVAAATVAAAIDKLVSQRPLMTHLQIYYVAANYEASSVCFCLNLQRKKFEPEFIKYGRKIN